MKKIWMLLIGLFGIATIGCADDKPIAFEQTPVAAQQFIKTHFPQAKVLYAKVDKDVFDRTYDVVMADGSQLEDLTGYTIPKNSGYYNVIRRINKEI